MGARLKQRWRPEGATVKGNVSVPARTTVPVSAPAAAIPPAVAGVRRAVMHRPRVARGDAFVRSEQGFPAQPHLARGVDVDDLDHDLLAFLELVPHVFDAVVGDFRDMEQAVAPGHDLDEGAEVRDALDPAKIAGIQLRGGRE